MPPPSEYETHPAAGHTWDPRCLEAALRGPHPGGAGPLHGETCREPGIADPAPPAPRDPAGLPAFPGDRFLSDTAHLLWLYGEEHDVYLDPAASLVFKLTQPGATGKGTPWSGYLRRLTLSNELLGDDIQVVGRTRLPGEPADRIIILQPLRAPHPGRPTPTLAEIDAFMQARGFEKACDGIWLHRPTDMIATDALPKNFMRDPSGAIHAIDLHFREPSDRESSGYHRDRIEAMVRQSAGGFKETPFYFPAILLPVEPAKRNLRRNR